MREILFAWKNIFANREPVPRHLLFPKIRWWRRQVARSISWKRKLARFYDCLQERNCVVSSFFRRSSFRFCVLLWGLYLLLRLNMWSNGMRCKCASIFCYFDVVRVSFMRMIKRHLQHLQFVHVSGAKICSVRDILFLSICALFPRHFQNTSRPPLAYFILHNQW